MLAWPVERVPILTYKLFLSSTQRSRGGNRKHTGSALGPRFLQKDDSEDGLGDERRNSLEPIPGRRVKLPAEGGG